MQGRFTRALIVMAMAALVCGSSAEPASAQTGIDAATRGALIEKFTRVYLGLAPSDPSRTAVTLRLADLHAERARLASLEELNQGCVTCTAGKADRERALGYYKEVLPKLSGVARGKVLTQLGHLYEMIDDEPAAIATYQGIIQESASSSENQEALAEAHLSLGQIHFKRRRYSEAKTHFEKVVAFPKSPSRGLASYRIAWCDFNEGKLESAIDALTKILKSPALLTRGSASDIVQTDKQFQEEVSRDLATFMARRSISIKEAELLYELSPEHAQLANITYLATEAERLGQVIPAISIWRFVIEKQSKPEDRLEAHVRLAHLQMGQKLALDAVNDFSAALNIWSGLGACPPENLNDQCKEIKARIRNFVTDWNRSEKTNPSQELLKSYLAYLKVFPNEPEVLIWAGKVASDRKDHALAFDLYLNGAKAAASSEATKDQVEAGLLGAIETAEIAKESAMRIRAYDAYLELSRDRKKALDVRYQKAHLIYEGGDYAAAAEALHAVALAQEPGELTLKKQAADLSLDALVLLKDDRRVETWANEYAGVFKTGTKEFSSIARKAVLTQSAGDTTLKAAWAALMRFKMDGASETEMAAYYKNKLILAEKMEKFGEARSAAEDMLRQKTLSAADREYALSRKAWLAELVLDFDTALAATEKITTGEPEKRWLKLAMYAELASKDAKPFYANFLKDSKDDDRNAAIAALLVREAKDPLKEIVQRRVTLMRRPEVLADLYLEIYAKDFSPQVAKQALAVAPVAKTAAGQIIARSVFLEELKKFSARIAAHRIDSSNQAKMARTLRDRVALVGESEKLAARAIESGDWTSQLASLDLLAKESERFYQEVLSLPVPAGLSEQDEQEYLALLSQQAAPHQVRAQDAAKKVEEFWANEGAFSQLETALKQETGFRRKLLEQEVAVLSAIAPESKKALMNASVTTEEVKATRPSLKELETARRTVRENPLSREGLEGLLVLERQIGRPAMVTYLEARLQSLPTHKAPEKEGGAL